MDKISGFDLNVFEFDYDLTYYVFFLSPDGQVYGRYGGRDAKSAEARLSLRGLRFAMQSALETHRNAPKANAPAARKPLLAEEYPAARAMRKGECIHCHQVWEFRRQLTKSNGTFRRDDLWVYPLPENVGLTLDNDQGNMVREVKADSPAARAGLKPGDLVKRLNGLPVFSFGDAQHALHRAPAQGPIPIAWQQGGQERSANLEVAAGWRKTNVTWRPSMLDILPALSLYGDDLTAAEKKALGLSEKRLAFRQDKTVGKEAQRLGVQADDIVVGINNEPLEMTMLEFLAYIRRNFLVGDKITLNVFRNGKRLDLPGQL
ncbi:MAG: PDZ domain-containing protein [Planctomycetia bacterium]|nr:PDZ domain-containing protein [Planctomycetia bacterium]